MPPETFIDEQDIAIIGMTGRFPGAKDVDALWRNVCNGIESIRPISDAELEKLGVDKARREDPRHVKASAVMDGVELFDAGFFGYTPREAELMDPQHRVFLECAWEALEHAGYAPDRYKGAISVFAGASTNTYLIYNLVPNADRLGAMDLMQLDVGNGADFVATRVAYKLDLRGPSYTMLSGCSTSLVATHVACQSLLNQECDMALAGGVSIQVKHPEGYPYFPGGVASPDGHCRAFDAKAEGTVFGSGVGVVVLKRLADAVKDGDYIHAIIKGSAINNDGSHKVGFTAPSVEGQAAVIEEALGAAGVEPESIGYIEAHGTGTQLGDPIEIRALTRAFRYKPGTPRAAKMRCAIGSLKSNIGHLSNASGVASLIKAVLALENQKLPPSLHFEKPSPEIDFANSPFYVNTSLVDWKAAGGAPRRAGVSSFGVGGTNAHVVLQEAPARATPSASRPVQLLVLSAKSEAALEAATDNLARHLEEHPGISLSDVAYTLQVGRQAMAFRRVVVCRDREEAVRALRTRDAQRVWTGSPTAQDRPVAFVFPAEGARAMALARELYASEPVFREHLDACATLIQPNLGVELLNRPELAGPARFSADYALARLWMSWGVTPKAMLGHGAGEYVAACLAGVLELRDALALVAGRAQPSQMKLNAPKIPFVSSVSGTWLENAQATSAEYWASLPRQAVRFDEGLKTLAQKPQQVRLEVGAGDTLTTLGRLWLDGVSPDWSGFYAREKRLRLPLPTYPFERQRYWLEAPRAGVAPRPASSAEKKGDIADWFYVPSWKRTAPPRAAQKAPGRGWLLFADAGGVAEALAPKLAQTGQPVIRVIPGDGFGRRADGTYTLDPRKREDYTALLQELQTRGQAFDGVVHLWGVTPEPVSLERALDTGFYSQLFLAQALGAQGRSEPLAWWVVANEACKVESAEEPSPEKAMLLGPCRVVPQEYPHLTCRFVDVATAGKGGAETVAGQLLAELQAGASDTVIAWRGRQRWVQTFEPVRLEAHAAPVRTLKEQGVYLVTGGLTGLGHALAGELARASRARLVLVEGPEFPAREQWTQWLSAHGEQDATSRRINAARALEAAGASVLVLGADLTDEARMRQVVARAVEHFGRLDGVIHAAGALGQGSTLGTIQETSASACASHFAPQVQGLRVLRQVLPAEGPGFCLLVSSLSSILGGFGQMAHAAASQYMDTFAERQNDSGAFPWISVDWDAVHFEESASLSAMSPAIARYALQPQEGLDVIRRIFTQAPGGQLVLSTGDLEARRHQGPRESSSPGDAKKKASAGHARPPLATPYVAPRTELERSVASVWQQVLGIEKIGVNDDFFELGGHSLLASQLRNQIHVELKVDLPLRGLFETPTVAATAAKIEQEQRKNAAASEKPIRERLRSAFPTERQGIMEDYLRRKIAPGLRLTVEQLQADGSLKAYDQQLLGAELAYNLLQDFKFQFYPHEVREHPSISEMARYLLAEMERLANPAKLVSDKPLSAYTLKPYRPQRVEGAAPARNKRKNPPMVFVHSSPRAGSTLFRVMLAGHPKLFCPPEVNLLFFENMKEWRENIGFGNEMEWTTGGLQWAFMELMGLDSAAGQALVDRFVAENIPAQEIFAKLQELSGPRLLVDKTPSYSLDPETLWRSEEMFDQPKYIFLHRHPYPVMESLVRLRFNRLFGPSLFGDSEVDPHVIAETVWALCNRNLLDFFSRVDPSRVLRVQYEQLVQEPTPVMTRVCEFLGLPFDERVVQPYDGKRERMMGGLGDPNILQHKGIDKGLGESWKKIKWPRPLDPSTLEIVARLGYEVEQSTAPVKPSAAAKPSVPVAPAKEEAPATPRTSSSRKPWHLLPLSAGTEAALDEATAQLATRLERHPETDIADVAYSLQKDLRTSEHRRAVVCRDAAEARAALRDPSLALAGAGTNLKRPVVFLCSGQGSQHVGMGRALYESEPVFHEAMDACAETLRPHLDRDLREVIYPAHAGEEAEALLNQIEWAQPAQFAVEYAMAKWWMSLGVEPEAMIGHSLGEYVAACLAGVFPLEDALKLVSVRGRLMQSLPPGAMLSVHLPEAELTPLLPPGANIGAMNGPALQMVSGTREAVAALEELLASRGVETRRLYVSHASHSAMMDPVLDAFTQEVSRLRLSPPKLPYVSTLTGTWVTPEQATDPKAWTRHLRQPVRFAEGATVLLRNPERVFLEVGPGNSLGTLVRGIAPAGTPPTVITSLPRPRDVRDAAQHALEAAARLWLAGAKVELSRLYDQPTAPPKPAAAPAPAAKKAPTKEEAERLLANLDQLSDEQVAELLAVLEADKENA